MSSVEKNEDLVGHKDKSDSDVHVITGLEDLTGSFGYWQANITFFYFVAYILTTFNNLGYAFQAANTDHHCDQLKNSSSQNFQWTTTNTEYVDLYLPSNVSKTSLSSCDPNCVSWSYNNSIGFHQTITSKFDLICGKEWLRSFSQSMYQVGYVFSGIIISWISDHSGRKFALKISIMFELLGGFMLILSQSAFFYILSRFILGFGDSGRGMCLYMLIMETVGKTKRADVLTSINFGWILGYLLLPAFAYLLRNYIFMQLVPTLTMVLMVFFWLPYIPQSPRWLLINKQISRAEKTLRQACQINGREKNFDAKFEYLKIKTSELIVLRKDDDDDSKNKKLLTFWSLITNRKCATVTLILWFSFFVNGFIYHGFSLNVEIIGGNMFFNFVLAGLIEIPSLLMSLIGMRYLSRKMFIISTILSATLCYTTIAIFRIFLNLDDYDILVIILSMLGKMFIFATFNAIYIHAGEIFPTKFRQTGVSSCSISARFGSTVAPFVKDLTMLFGLTNTIIIFSALSLVSAIGTFFLPETKNQELVDTIN